MVKANIGVDDDHNARDDIINQIQQANDQLRRYSKANQAIRQKLGGEGKSYSTFSIINAISFHWNLYRLQEGS
jgi:hypothetical protein